MFQMLGKTFAGAVLAASIAALFAFPAAAIEILGPATAGSPQVQSRDLDLNILRSQIQRQQYQQQQQQYRSEERQVIVPQRQDVPRMRQNCQIQVYGSGYTTVCR